MNKPVLNLVELERRPRVHQHSRWVKVSPAERDALCAVIRHLWCDLANVSDEVLANEILARHGIELGEPAEGEKGI